MALLGNSKVELEAYYNEAKACQKMLKQDIEHLKLEHEKLLLQIQQEYEDKVGSYGRCTLAIYS